MSSLTIAPKVALKLQPVPKSALYAAISGESLKNLGMKDDDQIRAMQQAVAEGLAEKVIVAGKHENGRYDTFTLTMKPFSASETVSLELSPGKSYLESLDVGLAAAVQHASEMITRLGLKPEFYVGWSAKARANPAIIRDAVKRLNLRTFPEAPLPPIDPPAPDPFATLMPSPPTPPRRYPQTVNTFVGRPALPPGFLYKPVLSVTPAKDPGITFTHETSWRQR